MWRETVTGDGVGGARMAVTGDGVGCARREFMATCMAALNDC